MTGTHIVALFSFLMVGASLAAAQSTQWKPFGSSQQSGHEAGVTAAQLQSPRATIYRGAAPESKVTEEPANGIIPEPGGFRRLSYQEKTPPTERLPAALEPIPQKMPVYPNASLANPPTAPLSSTSSAASAPVAVSTIPAPSPVFYRPGDVALSGLLQDPGGYGPRGQTWVNAEYLYWRTSGAYLPPLVTSSPVGTPRSESGVLGVPTTRLLYGDDTYLDQPRSGIRVRTGFWLDCDQTCGLEAGFFFLGTQTANYAASSTGDPLLSRPFFNTATGQQDAQLVTFVTRNSDGTITGDLIGTVGVRADTSLWGLDLNYRHYLCSDEDYRIDALFGLRYLRLRDTVAIGESLIANNPNSNLNAPFGTTFNVMDMFESTSNFYGAQVGIVGERRFGRWILGMTGKLAMGWTAHEVNINGSTVINVPDGGGTQNLVGGLLAQRSNIGSHRASDYTVVPELGVSLGYQLTDNVRLYAGYNVMYWSSVVRAGEQIDPFVDGNQIPSANQNPSTNSSRPMIVIRDTGFWVRGLQVGLELSW